MKTKDFAPYLKFLVNDMQTRKAKLDSAMSQVGSLIEKKQAMEK
jgi:hypothetical protein